MVLALIHAELKLTGMDTTNINLRKDLNQPNGSTNNNQNTNNILSDHTICNECGALFTGGKWTWQELPKKVSNTALCPACLRISENYPAGIIEIRGPFVKRHRAEILNMIDLIIAKEVSENPLERCLAINKRGETLVITTTGMHLARRIGDALYRSYEGNLKYRNDEYDENLIHVYWDR